MAPTRSNLRKIRENLSFAYEGFDLLDHKREILMVEIMKNINRIKEVEDDFKNSINSLYASYRESAMETGAEMMALKCFFEKRDYSASKEYTKIIGIHVPQITIAASKMQLNTGLYGTTAAYDRTKKYSAESLLLLGKYASVVKSVFILTRELKKVQRRVNALEKMFIPQQEKSEKYISERIEEVEREEVFVKRMLKERL